MSNCTRQTRKWSSYRLSDKSFNCFFDRLYIAKQLKSIINECDEEIERLTKRLEELDREESRRDNLT